MRNARYIAWAGGEYPTEAEPSAREEWGTADRRRKLRSPSTKIKFYFGGVKCHSFILIAMGRKHLHHKVQKNQTNQFRLNPCVIKYGVMSAKITGQTILNLWHGQFIEATGIDPIDAVLVEQHKDGITRWWFEKRERDTDNDIQESKENESGL